MPATEAVDLPQAAARLAACVREAGALALSMFGTPIKNWTKAGSSPVSEADIAVDRLLRERLTGEGHDFGWLSEESVDDPARLGRALCLDRRSDRRHPRLSRRPAGLDGFGGAGRERPADRGCLFAPVTDEFFAATPGAARPATARRSPPPAARRSPTPASPGRRTFSNASRRSRRPSPSCRGCLRWRCASPASRRAPSTSPSPAATVTTGTLQRLIFWCTKRAARSRPSGAGLSLIIVPCRGTGCWSPPAGTGMRRSRTSEG